MRQAKAGMAVLLVIGILSGVLGVQGKVSASAENLPFTDLGGAYGTYEIASLYNKGIMKGTSQTLFSPDRPITRAESLTALIRLLKLEPVQGSVAAFADVPASRWYYGTVQAGVNLGITEGTSPAVFAPEQPLTRQEAAVWLVRALKQQNNEVSVAPAFSDRGKMASWAVPSIAKVQQLGLMQGDGGEFRPNDPITRQETAVLMARVLETRDWSSKINGMPAAGIQLGWQYGQTTAQYEQSVLKSNVNTLSPRWLFLEKNGTVGQAVDRSLISWAQEHNRQVWPMVGNRFDADATHYILTDQARSAAAIKLIGDLVRNYSLDGINLDFENVYPSDRAALTSFVRNLAVRLHQEEAVLSVCVSPDLGTDWTEAFDYAALGAAADYMVLMGYDEHWGGGSTAGSVSSLPWLQRGLDRLVAVVPAGKVILALPLYTRDWSLNRNGAAVSSAELTLIQQNRLVAQYGLRPKWNGGIQQYTAEYTSGAVRHRIWMEDGRSLSRKYAMGASRRVAGFAYWYVNSESADVWPALRNANRFSGYAF
ncbi:S-layer homology domain-containing protein [Paenibacillus sp. YPG26]|uniref:S-layer homology domain-containing protein n=1 Tax=Paenibacillus sp. YPG26 TaxID=2878915 RepID=UPI00203C2FF7|nr:S-layer homology domain-containing protein [Paenibacillus sp. YPG26]USB33987.1 S-layer homology domain-containing protein [Paenibacillus sp. YPG26]